MNELLDRTFPHRNIKNIKMFYILSAVYNAWIVSAVWIFIWSMYMTKTQIGINDAVTFAVGFLVELPSGVFADLIGRKKAILIGNILLTIGNLFIALSSSFLSLMGWYLVWTVGYAFQSGATEALAYDSLKKNKLEESWHSVISTSTVIARVTSLLCTVLGGYLYAIHFRLPYLAFAATGVIGVLAALSLKEIPIYGKINVWSLHTYVTQIKDGVRVLFKKSVFPIGLTSLAVLALGFLYNWGLLRPLTAIRFGYTPTTLPLLLATGSVLVIASIAFFNKTQKGKSTESIIFISGLIYSVLFLVLGFNHTLIIGGLIMIALSIALAITDISFSKFINVHTEEKHRATTLSAVALFTKMPYVLLAFLTGTLADNNQLPPFAIVLGCVALVIWVISFGVYKHSDI